MAVKMNVQAGPTGMGLDLRSWRGYSAYEIAVQNGFEGSETEWLASLHGKNGLEAAVNGVSPDQYGTITITGEQIPVSTLDPRTLADAFVIVLPLAEALKTSSDGIDFQNKYIDNALFR
jgi:hypothetical protein